MKAARADTGVASLLMAGTAVGIGVITVSFWPQNKYPPKGLSSVAKKMAEWVQRGCGSAEYNFVAVFQAKNLKKTWQFRANVFLILQG